MAVDVGIVSNCGSLFIKPIAADFGVARTQVSTMQTIMALAYAFVSFNAGKIFTRPDLGKILKIDLFVLSIAYFSYSLCTKLWQFYALAALIGVAYALLGVVAFSVIIPNWFVEKRGRAIGLSFMGSGIGGMIFNYLAGNWIVQYGWRTTYQILAVCLFVIMAPFVLFVLKIKPSDIGLEPYGAKHMEGIGEAGEEEGMTFKDARKTSSFWIIALAGAAVGMCTNTLIQTISPHLTDIGYDTVFAATVVSLAMGSLAFGKLALGSLYDTLGSKKTTLLSNLTMTIGLTGLLFSYYKPAILGIFVGASLGVAFMSVAFPILIQNLFGRREYTAIYGFITGATGLVTVVMPMVNNMVYDKAGSYNPAYIFHIALSLIVAVVFMRFFTKIEKTSSEK